MKIDLHIHSRLSPCSILTIEEIIHTAADRGLDGVCITDHNTMEIQHFIKEGPQKNGIIVIFGMEYDTPQGDFLLFGPYENLKHGLEADELLNYVSKTGGVSIAAHPFRKDRAVTREILQMQRFHAIETLNGRNTFQENLHAENRAQSNQITACAGSDAHMESEIGSYYTEIPAPVTNREDLISAIKNRITLPRYNQNYSLLKSTS